jgi:hypothetical protein
MQIRRLLISVVLTIACAGQPSWQRLDLSKIAPVAADDQNAAETLLDETTIRYSVSPEGGLVADQTTHVVRRILTEDGRAWAVARVHYDRTFVDVTDFKARTTTPSGEESTFGKDAADDLISQPSWAMYDDSRVLVLRLRDVPVGSVVEWQYSLHIKQAELFSADIAFGDAIPVRQASLTVVAPRGAVVESQAQRLNEVVPFEAKHVDDVESTRWTWEQHDVAAIHPQPEAPPIYSRALKVGAHVVSCPGVSPDKLVKDARGMSAYIYKLAEPRAEVTPAIREVAGHVLSGAPDDPAEKAKRLYEWVRDRVSYCAIEIGIGGWQPHAANDVMSGKYGDCKDKANLLRTLLRAANVQSHLVAVQAHDAFADRYSVPGLNNIFNHMILGIDLPSGTVLVDPTCATAPYGVLPWNDQDTDSLPVTSDGSDIQHTPLSPADENRSEVAVDLNLSPAGTLEGKLTVNTTGTSEIILRAILEGAPQAKWDERLATDLRARAFELKDIVASTQPPTSLDPWVVQAGMVNDDPLPALLHGVRLDQVAPPMVPVVPVSTRAEPFLLGMPHKIHESVSVHLPAGVSVSQLPPPTHVETPAIAFDLKWSQSGDSVLADQTLTVRQSIVAAADLERLRSAVDEIHVAQRQPALLAQRGTP